MNTLDTIGGLLLVFSRFFTINYIYGTGRLIPWKYFMWLWEAVAVFEDFTFKIKNVTKNKADIEEVKTLKKSIFKVAEAVEKFALNYSKRHLSGMKPSKRILSSKMGELVALNPIYFQSLFLCYLLTCWLTDWVV